MKRSRVALSFFMGAYTMALVAVGTLDGGCLVAGDAAPKETGRPASKAPATTSKGTPAKPEASISRARVEPLYDACWDCDCFVGAPLLEPRPVVRPSRAPFAARDFVRSGLRSATTRMDWNHETCDETWGVPAPQSTKSQAVSNAQRPGPQRFDVAVPQFLLAPNGDPPMDRFDVFVPRFVQADVPKFAVSRGELEGWGVSGTRAMSPLARRVIEMTPRTTRGADVKIGEPGEGLDAAEAGQALVLRMNEENDGLGEWSPATASSPAMAPTPVKADLPARLSAGILLPMREQLRFHGRVVLDPSEGAGGLTSTSWMGCPRQRRDAAMARRAAGTVAQQAMLQSVIAAKGVVDYSNQLAMMARLLLVDAWDQLPRVDLTALRPAPARTTRQPSAVRGL